MVEDKTYFFLRKIPFLINPFVVSAIFVSIFVYVLKFPVKKGENFCSLCKVQEITFLTGTICSNPLKNEEKHIYSMLLECTECSSFWGVDFSCGGKIKIFADEGLVEAFFPGKLFTAGGEDVIFEKGIKIRAEGKMLSSGFKVSHCKKIKGKGIWAFLYEIRSLCRLKFRRLMFYWKDAGGLFLALLSGIREYASAELQDNFKNAGLSHILALSGMHLSIFTGLAGKLFGKVLKEKSIFAVQFFLILIFLWFAGLSPSLFRAFLCSVIIIFCRLLKFRKISMINVLSLSFLIHASIFPSDLFSPAFIFSYGALAGILLFSGFFSGLLIPFIPETITKSLSASISAQFMTFPLQLEKFGSYSPVGIIASCIVSPLVTVFIYSGLIIFLLSFIFPFSAECGVFLMNFLYNIIEKTVRFFSGFPILTTGMKI